MHALMCGCCCAVFTVITQAVYNALQAWSASGPSQQDSGVTLLTLNDPDTAGDR